MSEAMIELDFSVHDHKLALTVLMAPEASVVGLNQGKSWVNRF